MAGGSKDWHWLGTAVLAWPVVWVLRLLWLLHTKLDFVNGLLLCLKTCSVLAAAGRASWEAGDNPGTRAFWNVSLTGDCPGNFSLCGKS